MPYKFDYRGNRRLHARKPIPAFVAGDPVKITDLSKNGFGIVSDAPLRPGSSTWMELDWGRRTLRLRCQVSYSKGQRRGLTLAGGPDADHYRALITKEVEKLRQREAATPSPIAPRP
jgi:hypothetical protein